MPLGFIKFIPLFFTYFIHAADTQDTISWNSEQLPPYVYTQNGIAQGLILDILEGAFNTAPYSFKKDQVTIQGWSASYNQTIESSHKSVLFLTARSQDRENFFWWSGPIITSKIAIITLNSFPLALTEQSDIRLTKFISVKGDIAESMLKNLGAQSIQLKPTFEEALLRLIEGKADAIVYEESTAHWRIKEYGLNRTMFKTHFYINSVDLYVAFNKNFSQEEFSNWHRLLMEYIADPSVIKALKDSYIRP